MDGLASDLLRHVFQRAMLEHQADILDQIRLLWGRLVRRLPLQTLLPAVCPVVSTWLCMMMQPSRVPFDPSVLIFPPVRKESPEGRRRSSSSNCISVPGEVVVDTKYYIAGTDHVYESPLHREKGVTRARCLAASLLGLLSQYLVQPMPGLTYTAEMETPVECYAKLFMVHLSSRSSIQRTVVAMVMAEWAEQQQQHGEGNELAVVPPSFLMERLHHSLTECVYYDEIGVAYTRLLHDAKDFIATLKVDFKY